MRATLSWHNAIAYHVVPRTSHIDANGRALGGWSCASQTRHSCKRDKAHTATRARQPIALLFLSLSIFF